MSARRTGGGEGLALALAGVALATLAFAWIASALAGVAAGGDPVALSAADAGRLLARLPGHISQPQLAWPAADRARLPGATALDAVLGLTLILVGALAVGVLTAIVPRRRSPARAADWASHRELSELAVRRPQPGRVTLGRHERRLIAAETRASVLAVGPSQVGKTTGLVIPAILEWAGPTLSTSIKTDVIKDTHAARSALGDVRVFDPTECSGLAPSPWSPLSAARSWEGARRTAARLLGVGDQSARSADEAFWRPAGARFLAPLLLAAAHGGLTMRDVLRWTSTANEEEPGELLEACPSPGAAPALNALTSVWDADHRFQSSLLQTVATALDAWQETTIAASSADESRISARWLLDGPNTLYLVAPAHDQRRLRGLFTALVADIIAGAFERSAQAGGPIYPALLLALDEAANIAPLPNLDEIASTGPGQGVQLLTVLQNISQAADRWGRDRAETIIANHRARLFCSGIGDRATLDYLKGTLGDEEIGRVSTHRQSLLAAGGRTHSTDFRTLAAPHRVRQADRNSALLVYGRLAPAWVRLRPWYAHRRLRQLVEAPGAPIATHATARVAL